MKTMRCGLVCEGKQHRKLEKMEKELSAFVSLTLHKLTNQEVQ
jgi:hypothetical protein